MKNVCAIALIALLCGCRTAATPAMRNDTAAQDPQRLNSIIPKNPEKAELVLIEMVSYAESGDPTDNANRLFITLGQAFRTIDSLKRFLVHSAGGRTHFVLNGNDVMPGPQITEEEIDDLVSTCREANVWFTFTPGG